jgi:hypothetical protein
MEATSRPTEAGEEPFVDCAMARRTTRDVSVAARAEPSRAGERARCSTDTPEIGDQLPSV